MYSAGTQSYERKNQNKRSGYQFVSLFPTLLVCLRHASPISSLIRTLGTERCKTWHDNYGLHGACGAESVPAIQKHEKAAWKQTPPCDTLRTRAYAKRKHLPSRHSVVRLCDMLVTSMSIHMHSCIYVECGNMTYTIFAKTDEQKCNLCIAFYPCLRSPRAKNMTVENGI
jgi:hypothetical protein